MSTLMLWLFAMVVGSVMPISSDHADAAESRCAALGANCVCSEPLQATAYNVYVPVGGYFYNPNDTASQECNGEGISGYAVSTATPTAWFSPSTSSTILSALPAGHTVSRVMAGPEGHVGTWFTGHSMTDGTTFAKRLAARFYIYYSSNYGFDDDPDTCNASKLFQFDGHPTNNAGLLLDNGYGPTSLYNFLAFEGGTGSQDCCGFGALNVNTPSNILTSMSLTGNYTYYRGKWIRYEVVITNRNSGTSGIPVRFEVYVKNVTDNGSEYKIVDSCLSPGPLTTPCGHIPVSSVVFSKMLINGYRQDTCPGYNAYSHYMMAGWDTDAGQRIGAATEIEGSGVDSPVKGGMGGTIKAVGGVRLQ